MDAVVRSAMDMTAALGGNLAANAESIARVLETGVIPKTWGFAAALKEQIQKQIEAGDTAGALNAILGELGKRYGGQSQAELKTYNGMVKANTIAWKENEEIIGGKLLPILYNAQVGLNLLMTMNQKVTAALEDHEDQVLKTAKSYKAYAEEVIRAGMASESPGMTPSEIKARVEQYLREGATLEDLAGTSDIEPGGLLRASGERDGRSGEIGRRARGDAEGLHGFPRLRPWDDRRVEQLQQISDRDGEGTGGRAQGWI
jgi:hypothetical protein